ncbi:MAG: cyclic nucleotide-binding domain-containing protein [Magnetococcales bacterium]|nr:cyclic nucleotide-binding domain-containing protein [Magnetococcales bacterium]
MRLQGRAFLPSIHFSHIPNAVGFIDSGSGRGVVLKLKIIDSLAFFSGLSDDEKKTVSELNLRIFKYEPRTLIIKARGGDNHLFFLVKGTATVVGASKEPVAILKTGDVFGEISFLSNTHKRSADVVSNTDAIVMRVDREAFKTLSPIIREKLKDKLINIILERLLSSETGYDLDISTSTFDWAKSG